MFSIRRLLAALIIAGSCIACSGIEARAQYVSSTSTSWSSRSSSSSSWSSGPGGFQQSYSGSRSSSVRQSSSVATPYGSFGTSTTNRNFSNFGVSSGYQNGTSFSNRSFNQGSSGQTRNWGSGAYAPYVR